ncbi:40747_t:CDS:2, partial [Gigaspora margarita]
EDVTYLSSKRKKMESETCLISLVEEIIELVVKVVKNQVKRECQEQVISVRFIKIINSKV